MQTSRQQVPAKTRAVRAGGTSPHRRHLTGWALPVLIAVYLATIALVAICGTHPISDDWMYIDAAQTFAETGRVAVSAASVPIAIFEAVFGGIALWIFGGGATTLSFASATLAVVAAVGLHDLLVRSNLAPRIAILITGAFLFSSLFYGLSTTFMTDGHAVSLVVISAALFSRGIDGDPSQRLWLVAGSIAAAAAYLSRPGSLAVVVGVIVVAGARRRWSDLAWALAVPTFAVVTHLVVQQLGGGPTARAQVLERLSPPTPSTVVDLVLMVAIHAGIWLLPVAPMLAGALYRWRAQRIVRTLFFGTSLGIVSALLLSGAPFLGDWLNPWGLFPIDASMMGSRPPLLGPATYRVMVLIAVVVTAAAVALAFARHSKPRLRAAEIGLWGAATLSALLSLVSLVANSGTMLDRYLVLFLPAVLFSAAVRCLSSAPAPILGLSLALFGLVALISVLLTVDAMRLQDAVFETADAAVAWGIPAQEIDGGAAWTGTQFGPMIEADQVVLPGGPHWWREMYADGLEPRYVVTLNPPDATCVASVVEVPAFIGPDQRVALVDELC